MQASKRAIAKFEGHNDAKHIQPISQFCAAGMAGMIAQAVVYPLDTLKFRTQCETVAGAQKGNQLILETARKMWRTTGLKSYYRGLPMGLIGMFPYSAIDLFTFETLKQSVVNRNMKTKGIKNEEDALPSNFSMALMGAFSGAIGASAVYPINLLRTRLQSQGTTQHSRTYTGVMDVTRQTIRGEGFRGLFKGLTPNLLKVVPAVSIVSHVFLGRWIWILADNLVDLCRIRKHKESPAPALVNESTTDAHGRENSAVARDETCDTLIAYSVDICCF